jgi:hypothetical protein
MIHAFSPKVLFLPSLYIILIPIVTPGVIFFGSLGIPVVNSRIWGGHDTPKFGAFNGKSQ